MIRNASLFLAIRYLRPRRSFISAITFLSILGPVLGVAVLIIVLSVMAGFNRDIREKILGMHAHIQLKHVVGTPIEDYESVTDKLTEMGINSTPVVEGPVLIQTQRKVLAKYVKGIIPELEKHVSDLDVSVIRGSYNIDEDEVLIGEELAAQCGLDLGDKFLIHSPEKLGKMVDFEGDGTISQIASKEVYMPDEVTVSGIFNMGMFQYDSSIIILHLDKADELFGLNWDTATSIQIRTETPFDLSSTVEKIKNEHRFNDLIPITWQESNQRLFGALRVEKNLMFFVLIFIMIVAAFGIAATLITVVIQKTREIGVLKALGATQTNILMIFMIQGGFVGLLGTMIGTVLGLVVIQYRNPIAGLLAKIMGVEIFPKDLYHLSQIPALVQRSDLITIVLSGFFLCIIGALIPAIYATSLTPADALKDEL